MDPTPLDYVLRWTSWKMYVVCQFCEQLHGHGYTYEGSHTRRSDCFPGGSYRVVSPFETAEEASMLHFEINRSLKLYETVGIELRDEWKMEEDGQQVKDLAEQVQSLGLKHTGGFYAQRSTFDEVLEEEAQWLMSYCVTNDVVEFKHFSRTTKSSLQQLVSYVERDGNSSYPRLHGRARGLTPPQTTLRCLGLRGARHIKARCWVSRYRSHGQRY